MSEPMDLQAVLQNGYFTTSRAKSVQPSSPPRLTPPSSPLKNYQTDDEDYRRSDVLEVRRSRTRFRPPPPTCEDEVEALAKEYDALKIAEPPGEDIPSRGDVDQHPVLLEVHEHNPERRFVIIQPDSQPNRTKNEDSDSEKRTETQSGDERPRTPNQGRKLETSFADGTRPGMERRRSRQDLPPLDTDMRHDRSPAHHRTRSAVGTRPDVFSGRPSVKAHFRDDNTLSPDVIKSASTRREKAYHDHNSSTSGPRKLAHQRSYSNFVDDRGKRDRPQRRESVSPGYGSRSESHPDGGKSRRRTSTERPSESRYREPSTARSSRREGSVSYKRHDGEATVGVSTSKPRGPRPPTKEDSRSGDERSTGRRRGNSASIHQDAEAGSEKDRGVWRDDRSRPRGPAAQPLGPAAAMSASSVPKDIPVNPRSSATFPIPSEDNPHLPYPDEIPTSRNNRSPGQSTQTPSVSMPDISFPSSLPSERIAPSERGFERNFESPTSTKGSNHSAWAPPSFDPDRDGVAPDQDMGSYRRYSSGQAGSGIPVFPECHRKEPVAGQMDWLTLPRTDFNICPECYQGVFANTEFRTQFQPMLRPTDKAIACDFGSSPWYRIAYLLTIKNEHPDLRLIKQVDSVATASRNQPCPMSRKAPRNWFSVRDPYKRRMVPNFTVCYQCAKTVEVLLPNLMGTFISIDSRAEPLSSVCALHFRPQRKRFALYFDILETTADKAVRLSEPPDVSALAVKLERLSSMEECREDSPIPEAYWHNMQYLPEFTVCGDCFNEVVRPRLRSNVVARNFYKEPQRMPLATCQLYSERMREIFRKACQRNDAKYLKAKVVERQQVEMDIHSQLVKLDKENHDEAYTEEQVAKLIAEWKKWE